MMSSLIRPLRRNTLIGLGICVVSLSALSGCGGDQPPPVPTPAPAAPAADAGKGATKKAPGRPEKYKDEDSSAHERKANRQAK